MAGVSSEPRRDVGRLVATGAGLSVSSSVAGFDRRWNERRKASALITTSASAPTPALPTQTSPGDADALTSATLV